MQISANYSKFFSRTLIQSIEFTKNGFWSNELMYMPTHSSFDIICSYIKINTNDEKSEFFYANFKHHMSKITPKTTFSELLQVVDNFTKRLNNEINEYNQERERFNNLSDTEKENEIYNNRFNGINRYEPNL